MFKIEIQADDGRELKMTRDNFIYFKFADGTDTFWEWEHVAGRADDFDALFAKARQLVDAAEKRLPDMPMSGLR